MNADPVALAVATGPIVDELCAILAEEPDCCLMTDLSAEGGQPIGISVNATALDLSIYVDEDVTDRQRDQLEDAGFAEDAAQDGALVKHWDIRPLGEPSARAVLDEAVSLGLRVLHEVFHDGIEQINVGWDGYVLTPTNSLQGATSA